MVKKARLNKWSVWGLEGGLITFVEGLEKRLLELGVEIQMEKDVLDKVTDQGLVKDSDFTFWSTPAFKTSEAMSDKDLSDVLATIPFVDVAVINYVFESSELVKNPGKKHLKFFVHYTRWQHDVDEMENVVALSKFKV